MFTIGEFSKITNLPVKTLRFYHEKGLLTPSCVDVHSGYRYYDDANIERARVIKIFRELDFPIGDITEILARYEDDSDILDYVTRQRDLMREKIEDDRGKLRALEQLLEREKEARTIMEATTYEIEEKTVAPLLIAAIRMKGHYSECGKAFARLGRAFGRHIAGKAFCLHYDEEYQEVADFEACMPIKRAVDVEGIEVRELGLARCVTLLHRGPYDDIGRSYARVLAHVRERGYDIVIPSREVYILGPGMIFRGNPKKYLTEIQLPIRE